MADMNPDSRVYQSGPNDPAVVYTTPDSQQVHILHGGAGTPNGPYHGHTVYNVVQDRIEEVRPPGERI